MRFGSPDCRLKSALRFGPARHNDRVPIWGVVNQKGGVGKTTTAVNLASGLALRGKSVLLVDSDPQGNATTGLGIDKTETRATLYDVLSAIAEDPDDRAAVNDAIVEAAPNLFIIPATLDLAGAEPMLLNAVGKETILKEALHPLKERFDWIIIDAPPSLGLLTINVLCAADRLVVPMQCEFYALEGLSQLMKTIDIVRKRLNSSLTIEKVLFTMYDSRNRLSGQVADEVRNYFNGKVAQTVIPRNVRLSEAPGYGEPAVSLYPSSKGATAYMAFVDEVLGMAVAA